MRTQKRDKKPKNTGGIKPVALERTKLTTESEDSVWSSYISVKDKQKERTTHVIRLIQVGSFKSIKLGLEQVKIQPSR